MKKKYIKPEMYNLMPRGGKPNVRSAERMGTQVKLTGSHLGQMINITNNLHIWNSTKTHNPRALAISATNSTNNTWKLTNTAAASDEGPS